MPRPTTKAALLQEADHEYSTLERILSVLTPEQKILAGALGDWSVKDVLAHLTEWQQMFFVWYEAGKQGDTPPVPASGFKWSQLPALNQAIYEKYRDVALEKIEKMFLDSHRQTMAAIQAIDEEELFTPGRYAWCRNNRLAAYFISNTSSHYRWAYSEIRKNLKTQIGGK